MDSSDQHKQIYRRVIAAVSDGDRAALDHLLAPDVLDHNPIPNQAPGIEGFNEWMQAAREAFPDLRGEVEAVVAEGDMAAGRVTWRGTQRGVFLGVPPTGKPVTLAAFHLVRFSAGRIVEWWGAADLLGALNQLGGQVVVPTSTGSGDDRAGVAGAGNDRAADR
jgi:steroid delta-isomerase-like uncharacterized protein